MTRRAQHRWPCRPDVVHVGRRFVGETLEGWGLRDGDPGWELLDEATLVASELLTNALRVCDRLVELEITADDECLCVAVTDDGEGDAALGTPTEESTSGRGLLIVDVLSESWGQRPVSDAAKAVWCRFRIPEGSVLGA